MPKPTEFSKSRKKNTNLRTAPSVLIDSFKNIEPRAFQPLKLSHSAWAETKNGDTG